MDFTLTYRGRLASNGTAREKHDIRRIFHQQLQALWTHSPIKMHLDEVLLPRPADKPQFTSTIGAFRFLPLVSRALLPVARLKIILLRHEPPGLIITQSGDIDNQLKTLFDALRAPHNTNEIPAGDAPQATEDPFFCLLEDDNLITKVSVETQQWLEPSLDKREVLLLVQVEAVDLFGR